MVYNPVSQNAIDIATKAENMIKSTNLNKAIKINDYSFYSNLILSIVFLIFSILVIVTITYTNSDKIAMNITYQATYFILATMFLFFTIQYIFKYNYDNDSSPLTFKTLLTFATLFLVYLNTGLTHTKKYHTDKGPNSADTATNIQYTNGVFALLIGLLYASPAVYMFIYFLYSKEWIGYIHWLFFGIAYTMLGGIYINFAGNPKANKNLYIIPIILYSISLVLFIIKMVTNYNDADRITTLRDSIYILMCTQIIINLLKNIVKSDTGNKVINWLESFILLTFSAVNISIFKLNPARAK
jgi:hypothetical protein